jgi:hypothetical protein
VLRIHSAKSVNLEIGDRVYVKAFVDYVVGVNRDVSAGLRDTNLQIIRIPGVD